MATPSAPVNLSKLTTFELSKLICASLSGSSPFPEVYTSLGQTPSEVWASIIEREDVESPFRAHIIAIISSLVNEMIISHEMPTWGKELCELILDIYDDSMIDQFRILVPLFRCGIYTNSKYKDNDIDRLILRIMLKTSRYMVDTWKEIIRSDRYADIAHEALSTSLETAMLYLPEACMAISSDYRRSALVWITLDHYLNETGDLERIRQLLPQRDSSKRIAPINEWLEQRGKDLLPKVDKFVVKAQIPAGGSCPKKEQYAWDYETKQTDSLTDCIAFLIDEGATGFEITKNGTIIAEKINSHYPCVP